MRGRDRRRRRGAGRGEGAGQDDRITLFANDLWCRTSRGPADRPLAVSLPTRQCTIDKVSALKQVLARIPGPRRSPAADQRGPHHHTGTRPVAAGDTVLGPDGRSQRRCSAGLPGRLALNPPSRPARWRCPTTRCGRGRASFSRSGRPACTLVTPGIPQQRNDVVLPAVAVVQSGVGPFGFGSGQQAGPAGDRGRGLGCPAAVVADPQFHARVGGQPLVFGPHLVRKTSVRPSR